MAWQRWLCCAVVVVAVGCDSGAARFRLNEAYIQKNSSEEAPFSATQKQDIVDILAAMFGSPDVPTLPPAGEIDLDSIVDLDKLQLASGPVVTTASGRTQGLYRQHCVHCHGITGDGAGPTAAFLNPYPRDYRMGVFKFKGTPKGYRPNHDDLKRILVNGIPGTAMPSFRLLADDELDALVHYVKYLAIRGQVERKLIEQTATELDGPESRLETSKEYLLEEVVAPVLTAWAEADGMAKAVAQRTPTWTELSAEDRQASVAAGRELFYGPIANCVKCHGNTQLGDGQTTDFDDWYKDFHDPTKEPNAAVNQQKANSFVALGGLQPRNIKPRNLRDGSYRGGRRYVDLYWRIVNGIDGTPMPGAPMKPEGAAADAQGLTPDDVWHLVDYVLSLPNETLSNPRANVPVYQRERM